MIVLLTSKKLPALFLLTNDISAIFICSPLCLAFFIQILYLLIIQNHLEFLAVEDPMVLCSYRHYKCVQNKNGPETGEGRCQYWWRSMVGFYDTLRRPFAWQDIVTRYSGKNIRESADQHIAVRLSFVDNILRWGWAHGIGTKLKRDFASRQQDLIGAM